MLNCLTILKEKYNLQGYSGDTIFYLRQKEANPDECESFFWYLEAIYG